MKVQGVYDNSRDNGMVACFHCGVKHVAEYHHDGQWGQGPIFIVYCTTRDDGLADFYTNEVVER